MTRTLIASSLGAVLLLGSSVAFAQDWTGGYVGGHVGSSGQPGGSGERVVFDTNLDGSYDDTVRTVAGADAFGPGFCDGAAQGSTPADGCRGDSDGTDFGLRAGFDWQAGALVYGIVADYSRYNARDSVAAFSVTPAFYTFNRELDSTLAIRGRIGAAFGQSSENLVYLTAGPARGSISHSFETDNGANTFVERGGGSANGYQAGVGYERRFSPTFSLGLEYLYTSLRDRDYTVRSQGPAPATNPFILVNADGTDLRRSSGNFDVDSVRLTANFRF